MAELEIPISQLDPASSLTGDEILVLVQGGVTVKALLSVIATFLGSSGTRITDSGTIATITTNSNYNDSYGNPSPSIGGVYNTTLPSGINEGDYYIEPFATDGMPKHKIECKKNADGDLILIKIPYLQ